MFKKALIYISLTLLLTGCLHTPYVERNQYLLSAPPIATKSLKTKMILAIPTVNIVTQFAGNSFVYRKSDLQYQNDFYNTFMTPPADQIKQILLQYFEQNGLFAQTTEDMHLVKPNYILVVNITELYADYRDKKSPAAVITLQAKLLKNTKPTTLLLTQTFHAATPLAAKTTDALLDGWNQDLAKILKNMSQALQKNIA